MISVDLCFTSVDLPNKGFKGCGNQACFGAKHDESNVIIIYR